VLHLWVEFIDHVSMTAALSSSTPSVRSPRRRTTWVCRPQLAKSGTARAAVSISSRQGVSESNDDPPRQDICPQRPRAATLLPPLPALRCQPTALPSFSPSTGTDDAELETNALGQQMRSWVEDAGGYINPALALSCATPYGRWGGAARRLRIPQQPQQPACACVLACPGFLLLMLTDNCSAASGAEELWQ
jgi:hypothetical protein